MFLAGGDSPCVVVNLGSSLGQWGNSTSRINLLASIVDACRQAGARAIVTTEHVRRGGVQRLNTNASVGPRQASEEEAVLVLPNGLPFGCEMSIS